MYGSFDAEDEWPIVMSVRLWKLSVHFVLVLHLCLLKEAELAFSEHDVTPYAGYQHRTSSGGRQDTNRYEDERKSIRTCSNECRTSVQRSSPCFSPEFVCDNESGGQREKFHRGTKQCIQSMNSEVGPGAHTSQTRSRDYNSKVVQIEQEEVSNRQICQGLASSADWDNEAPWSAEY